MLCVLGLVCLSTPRPPTWILLLINWDANHRLVALREVAEDTAPGLLLERHIVGINPHRDPVATSAPAPRYLQELVL